MSDQTRDPRPEDGGLGELLSGLEPPAHRPNFWRALDARIDLVNALRDAEVPDPYYGGPRGFEDVFDMCEGACRGLIDHLRRSHGA